MDNMEDDIPSQSNSVDANSSNVNGNRPSCKFGQQCYRTNPSHRLEESHPGDADYSLPRMPSPLQGVPKCKYGRNCYRLNPQHFLNFRHPRNTNFQANNDARRQTTTTGFSDDSSEGADEDPFADDSGSDYIPSDNSV